MITVIFVTLVIVQNIMCAVLFDTGAYRKECIDDLNLNMQSQREHGSFFLTNSQIHDLQCLDRCVLIKCGIIDENETIQATTLKEQLRNFPNSNISTNVTEACPVLQNITDKCEKGYLIGRCIQYQLQRMRFQQHKQGFRPHFQEMPPPKWREFRAECLREANATNSNGNATFEIGFCTQRCIMMKMGVIDANNAIQEGKIKELFGDNRNVDVNECGIAAKNGDKCKEAMDIKRCLNRIPSIHV